jgi:hypothetical protein
VRGVMHGLGLVSGGDGHDARLGALARLQHLPNLSVCGGGGGQAQGAGVRPVAWLADGHHKHDANGSRPTITSTQPP